MTPPTVTDARTADTLDLSGFAPAELRRRLRHACVLLGAADVPTEQREQLLRRARGHIGGTLHKLDRLIAEVAGAPVPMDEQLTERLEPARIDPSP